MRRSSCQFDNDKSACKKRSRLLPVDDLAGNNADWLRNHSITISQDRERHYGQKCQSSYRLGSVRAKRCREAANGHIKGHRSGARREERRPQALEMDPTFCERSPQTSTWLRVTLVWRSLPRRRFLSQCEQVRLGRPTAYPRRVCPPQFFARCRAGLPEPRQRKSRVIGVELFRSSAVPRLRTGSDASLDRMHSLPALEKGIDR
jgi:hypothetical protein